MVRGVRSDKDKEKTMWVNNFLVCNFFGNCGDHRQERKKEKNMFCIDCEVSLCKHCLSDSSVHSSHQRLQILKYVYENVVRIQDIQKYLDSSKIQTYKINGERAVHINPRPLTQGKEKAFARPKGGLCCETCGRYIQDSCNGFCSIACKFLEAADGNGSGSLKSSDEEVNTSATRNVEIGSPSSIREEGRSCVTASGSPMILVGQEGLTTESLLEPSSPLKKRRKGYPCRAPFF